MILIGICDDSLQDRKRLVECIKGFFWENDSEIELIEYDSGEDFLKDGKIDILFLDIEMSGVNGIDIKEKLQKENLDTRIIFTTSHNEMMEEAFGKQVFGFLCKPVNYEKFKSKLKMALKDMDEEYQVVLTGTAEGCCVNADKILYIRADGKYSDVKLENQESMFSDKSIGIWTEELKTKGFFLCHRSYLVKLYQVRRIEDEIVLLNGEKIPVSRRMKSNLRTSYRDYIKKKAR